MKKFASSKPGGITVTQKDVIDHYEQKGKDAIQVAIDYLLAWMAKVPVGKQTLFAKTKCDLSEEPCGCAPDNFLIKCKGPYPKVPIEIIFEIMEAGLIDGLEAVKLPAPTVEIVDGHMHLIEFVGPYSDLVGGPAMAWYLKKVA